ncbi:MAG: DUF349 domain-containing protein [Thermomicrobiales bacterium]|nr:DUF349 domain-containing protein [Thermomicrobiales bacterium]MCO5226530.1 DUF349 domain-containing protein [Thermomicrobiales bacterium]
MSHPDSYPAASTDDIVFDDRIVGYVNRDGAIHMVDGERDREIGHVANDRDFAIGVLRDRYLAELDATRTWCAEVRGDEQRLRRFSDADRRLSDVDALYVLGDLELIRSELRQLGEDLRISQKARIAERDTLIAQVKQISDRTDWKTAAQELDALAAQFKAFGTVGDREIDTKQWDAFKEHERAFRTRRRQHFAEMEAEFANRAAAKEQLCEEAEQLAGDPDVRAAGLRMRQLMDHWKEVGFAGRERDDALWARFNAARDVFNTHRTEWYTANAVTKQDLAEQAEALMQQEDVADAQIKMKPLMQQWKATGSAGKEADDALWGRFRAAQDDVYTRSRVVFDARQAERDANYAARQALISEAESLLGQDSRTATARCKELQAEWKKIGPVSRERGEAQWKEFRAICDRIFGRAQQENKRRAQDARGHAEDQIRKLSAEIDEHERKIAHWEEVIAGLRDGPQADEIRASMEEKIATARQRIELKLTWIEEQHRRMTELGSRL